MRTKSKSIYRVSALAAILALGLTCESSVEGAIGPIPTVNSIQNPSFETGDFTGWQTEPVEESYGNFQVQENGYNTELGFFSTTPTDGNFAATSAFDSVGPSTIRLFQDVSIPCGAATLVFDYRAGWNMRDFQGSTLPRYFYVAIEPAGGGSILQSNVVVVAQPGTQSPDSGPLTMSLNATAYQGTAVRISFNFFVPETFSGPAFAQIDNVRLISEQNVAPTDFSLGTSSVNENQPIGHPVGSFTGIDLNAGDLLTYTLVSGAGDTDNASFSTDGNLLKTAAIFDYETKTSYSIRVRATDYCGGFIEKQLTISISNLVAIPGIYNGLFSEGSGVKFKSAGYFTLKVGPTLRVSGKTIVDGDTVAFSGTMNGDGSISTVTRKRVRTTGKPELAVNISLDSPATARLTGTLVQGGVGGWTSAILAYRALPEQASTFFNSYTMVLTNNGVGPLGSGFGLLSVSPMSKMRLAGRLADGHPWRASTIISEKGHFPLFSRAYPVPFTTPSGKVTTRTRGFTMGWLQFTNNNGTGNFAPVGEVHWIKTGWTNDTFTAGFTNVIDATSSRWLPPARLSTIRALDMTNVLLSFSDGDLGTPFEATYFLTDATRLIQIEPVKPENYPNGLKAEVGLRDRKGLITGSFVHPGNPSVRTRWFGAALQDLNYGEGFFMGPNISGRVKLESAD